MHAKRKYVSSINTSDQKAFWKATKFLIRKSPGSPSSGIARMKLSRIYGEKAAILNDFFSQCFNTSVPVLSEDDRSTFVDSDTVDSYEFAELLCTEEEVLDTLHTLDTSKETGQMGYQLLC